MEAGDLSVSTDLLIRALLSTGALARDIAQAITPEDIAPEKALNRSTSMPSMLWKEVVVFRKNRKLTYPISLIMS